MDEQEIELWDSIVTQQLCLDKSASTAVAVANKVLEEREKALKKESA